VEPERRFTFTVALKVATAANLPVEALMLRWTPIKDLPLWQFLETAE